VETGPVERRSGQACSWIDWSQAAAGGGGGAKSGVDAGV
jgi:hypothetical protein